MILYSNSMFLTPHTDVALAIKQSTGNPVLAFVVAWVSHFLLDLVPHGDRNLDTHAHKFGGLSRTFEKLFPSKFSSVDKKVRDKQTMIAVVGIIDAVLAGILFVAVWVYGSYFNFWVAFFAAAGATLPDVIWGMYVFFPKLVFLEKYQRFHRWWHHLLSDPLSLKAGMVLQGLVLALSAITLFAS